ncbi:MAG: hypothetical protein JNK21_06450 [Rhodospirillaceae bacterium]|nr:hypothetical protein [Rhodospirillaceae bacterium]
MKLIHAAAVALALAPAVAAAQDSGFGSFSGSIAATTDYVFRGYSQSDEHPAIQPGLNWDSGVGLHLNLWGSNVDFNDGGEADVEVDFTAGFAGSVGNLNYDVGAIYYAYPGSAGALNYDYWEGYTTLSFAASDVATLNGAIYYSPDFFGGLDDAWALQGGFSRKLDDSLTFDAFFGTQMLKAASGSDYLYWSAGLTYSFPWFDANVRYHDTDVSVCGGQCGARAVLTLSKSF